jgi:cell fate (sporulation/competence/biofilm development) regulator YlbF (YheA/YmcA/DUF963 family)
MVLCQGKPWKEFKIRMERITRAEVMRAAKEFGEALFVSKEMQALKQTEEDFEKNEEARRLLSAYRIQQRLLQMARTNEVAVREEEMAAFHNLEAKVKNDALVQNLIERRKIFQETMKSLNMEISGLLGIDFSANSSTGGCC